MNPRTLAYAFLLLSGSVACAQESKVHVYTPPSVVKFDVSWPGSVDREALVYLEFTISTEGKAINARLAEGGFHKPRFVDAAMKGLGRAQFKPAMVDGQPVEMGTRMPVRFAVVGQEKGVTPDFMVELKKVEKLVGKKDYADAHFHAQWMLAEKVNLLFEYAVLQGTLAKTYAAVGQHNEALLAARLATAPTNTRLAAFTPGAPRQKDSVGNYMLPKQVLQQMLILRFNLAASLGFTLDALEAHAVLQDLGDLAPDDPVARTAQQLTQLIQSDRPLVGKAMLDLDGNWPHRLSRRTFAIDGLHSGSLGAVKLTCEGNTRILEFQPDVEWNVPGTWNSCNVAFQGTPGAQFRIVEFAPGGAKPPATP